MTSPCLPSTLPFEAPSHQPRRLGLAPSHTPSQPRRARLSLHLRCCPPSISRVVLRFGSPGRKHSPHATLCRTLGHPRPLCRNISLVCQLRQTPRELLLPTRLGHHRLKAKCDRTPALPGPAPPHMLRRRLTSNQWRLAPSRSLVLDRNPSRR